MLLTDISYLKIWWPFIQQCRIVCAILKEGILRSIFMKWIFNVDQWIKRRCKKYFLSTSCSLEQNHLGNIIRGP